VGNEGMSRRLPYQITRGGLIAFSMAVLISLGLFWYGAEAAGAFMQPPPMRAPEPMARPGGWWAIFAGASFLGGALGAAIGQVFRDERGGAASMGAFVGVLAGPPIVVILFIALVVAKEGWSIMSV
jgi:hypothetical protein